MPRPRSTVLDREIAAAVDPDGALAGVCGVCLREIQLRGERPIRHGFSAIGVRHGTSGGYHTGPCPGTRFPHLGISTAGTEWALGDATARLAKNSESLAELATNPAITWYPERFGKSGLPDFTKGIVIAHGTPSDYKTGAPAYDYLHRRRLVDLTSTREQLTDAIRAYERVLQTWQPQPAKPLAPKVETTHLAHVLQSPRFGEWTGIACRFLRPGRALDKLAKTTDPRLVTCKRCRAIVDKSAQGAPRRE